MTKDNFGRVIDYLRISVTDRCNLRCVYCMPEEGVPKQTHSSILTLEEIAYFVKLAASVGFKHIRLTGGEPLVRLGIIELVRDIVNTDGIESVAMTTNGILLPAFAKDLKAVGLDRVNISLDTLDSEQFAKITRKGTLSDVMCGIEAAFEYGLEPVKLNVVVVRRLNQDFAAFLKLTMDRPIHVRFIEYMPIGDSREKSDFAWTEEDTIPNEELITLVEKSAKDAGFEKLIPLKDSHSPEGWGPAKYYKLEGSKGSIGFISALSTHFCNSCNRVRLTADGKLRPCLFNDTEYLLSDAIRAKDDPKIVDIIKCAIGQKPDGHHHRIGTVRQMSSIGG